MSTQSARALLGDAYLLWLANTSRRFFPKSPMQVVLFVAFNHRVDARLRSSLDQRGVRISVIYDGYSYATARVALGGLQTQLAVLLQAGASCITLASPSAGPGWTVPTTPVSSGGPARVLGIIDDGCPFAHRDYRGQSPGSFAVRFIWDQGGANPGNAPGGYGQVLLDSNLKQIVAGATTAGVVDEDSAYRASGLPSLREATSHGAQVLSHATGNARPRRAPNLPGRNDIAFVQLPPDALDDPSGRWLDHYALDGIQTIRFYARKMFQTPAQHVVVNLSYGPQTGPHDGSSIFEQAVDEMITTAASQSWRLDVVVPSGNSHLARGHAEFLLGKSLRPLTWCVSPDSQVASYLEVWPPLGLSLNELDVALVSPTGEIITAVDQVAVNSANNSATVTAKPFCGKQNQYLILMVVGATARPVDSTSPIMPLAVPGRWQVRVTVRPGKTASGTVHAYLARLDPNLGRKLRGHSGHFDSPTYDPKRYLRASPQLVSPPSTSPVEVRADGSLNGIATSTRMRVAAGYVDSRKPPNVPRQPSLYSSGAPSRGQRVGPDYAYPTDDSAVLDGRLAGGNRSGTVMRLVGTSFAAPMYALDVLDPNLIRNLPTPNQPSMPSWFLHRCGKGQRKA